MSGKLEQVLDAAICVVAVVVALTAYLMYFFMRQADSLWEAMLLPLLAGAATLSFMVALAVKEKRGRLRRQGGEGF